MAVLHIHRKPNDGLLLKERMRSGKNGLGDQPNLLEIPEQPPKTREPKVLTSSTPVWTDNKSHFIMRYLRYFVFITKHGTYIDGFAGPQEECQTESWSAKLVLESEPRWVRHFHLCDLKKSQINLLQNLKSLQPERDAAGKKIPRDIHIYRGDFNEKVDEILAASQITDKEATFCLIDQRTFECDWATVEKLVRFKKGGHKIELFYFLANSWIDRALSGQKDLDRLEKWWGRDDWNVLRNMTPQKRRDALVSRFRTELNYASVKPWPIYERESRGKVMYYMIHATDHPEAPTQMSRAYRNTLTPLESMQQLELTLSESKKPESQRHQPGRPEKSA
jgi:three-Cys-motif partner protein